MSIPGPISGEESTILCLLAKVGWASLEQQNKLLGELDGWVKEIGEAICRRRKDPVPASTQADTVADEFLSWAKIKQPSKREV